MMDTSYLAVVFFFFGEKSYLAVTWLYLLENYSILAMVWLP